MLSLWQAYKINKEPCCRRQQLCVVSKAISKRAHTCGSWFSRALFVLATFFCIVFFLQNSTFFFHENAEATILGQTEDPPSSCFSLWHCLIGGCFALSSCSEPCFCNLFPTLLFLRFFFHSRSLAREKVLIIPLFCSVRGCFSWNRLLSFPTDCPWALLSEEVLQYFLFTSSVVLFSF